jgi:DNA-directed RNA polymerase I subunit RPA2
LTYFYNNKSNNGEEKGVVGTQLIGERAQIILDEVRNLSLFTRKQCLKHIGTFRIPFFCVYNPLKRCYVLCSDLDDDLPNAGEYFRPVMEGFEKDDYETVIFSVFFVFILICF